MKVIIIIITIVFLEKILGKVLVEPGSYFIKIVGVAGPSSVTSNIGKYFIYKI